MLNEPPGNVPVGRRSCARDVPQPAEAPRRRSSAASIGLRETKLC